MKLMSVKELMNLYAFDGVQAEQTKEALENNYVDPQSLCRVQLYIDKCYALNLLYKFIVDHNERYS